MNVQTINRPEPAQASPRRIEYALCAKCLICGEVVGADTQPEFDRLAAIHYSAEHCG